MLFYRMQFKLFRYMENLFFCNENAMSVVAQSVSVNQVLTPAEQFDLVLRNDVPGLLRFMQCNRFDPDVEPVFIEYAAFPLVRAYHAIYELSAKALKALTTRFCNV